MEFCLVPTLGKWAEGQPRSVVVMDNSTNHTGLRTRMLIEDAGARLIFTAPNAADLNPIKYCFHVYKADLKRTASDRRQIRDSITSAEEAHLHALQDVTTEKVRAVYRHLNGGIRNIPSDKSRAEDRRCEDEAAVIVAVTILHSCYEEFI